tara:strand:- start:1886 stop:2209 length:324 start_codon:yes stop_codon:yes gene_type:complete
MLEYGAAMFLNKKMNEEKDEFTNNNSNNSNTGIVLSQLVYLGIFVYALVLFFKCKGLRGEFKFLEFLGALCYPVFYVIYRLVVPVNEDNCKSQAQRIAEAVAKVKPE